MSKALEAKKLVSVSATSTSMTSPRKETLKRVFCIYYPVQFKKNIAEVQALIDSKSEVNTMATAYAKKLGLRLKKTDIGSQKIDGSTLETYGMVIAGFQD